MVVKLGTKNITRMNNKIFLYRLILDCYLIVVIVFFERGIFIHLNG